MGLEEVPIQPSGENAIAAEVAALSARVEALERELAEWRSQPATRVASPVLPPPPPRVVQAPQTGASAQVKESKAKPVLSLEDRIGSQLFSRIGIVALLVAMTLFLKWAIDNHYIGPVGRVLAGLVAGTAVVLWSERFRRKGFSAFSYSLKAIGSGALYLSLWAAFQLYHLLPSGVALGAMVLVTAWNAYMAWAQDSEILAAYALAGGFATPLLLASGGNHEAFLFGYILAIDVATVVLVRLKPWPRLLWGAFPATVAFFIGWYLAWYGHSAQSLLALTIVFIALFFVTFIVPSISTREAGRRSSSITGVVLPLANAAFAALALYAVLDDAGYHDLLPWCAVLFAAIYLGLMRVRQARVTSAVHLALAVVFLTVAIPLKASGRWITIGWMTEGVALLWVSARLSLPAAETTDVSVHRILRRLAMAALALGFCGLLVQPFWISQAVGTPFLNGRFGASIFGIAALAVAAWIALRARAHEDQILPSWRVIAWISIVALNVIAILASVRELDAAWSHTTGNPDADLQKALAISAFLMIYGAGLLAVGFWKRTAFIRWQALLLLVFTIAKTFVYDMRSLSQGYRVLSFLGLGALLMAVSFAYQKDWLALRSSVPSTSTEGANQ